MIAQNELQKFQQRFKEAVCAEKEPSPSEKAAIGLASSEKFSLETRLEIYRYAYWARIEESLEEDFEPIHAILGAKRFSQLARAFWEKYPSRFASLAEVSIAFPQFLKEEAPWSESPYLSDIARLEWAKMLSYKEELPEPSNLGKLGTLSPEELGKAFFVLDPSVLLFESEFSVSRKIKWGTKASTLRERNFWVIYRKDDDTETLRLNEKHWAFLQGISKGMTLPELSELCLELKMSDAQNAKLFQEWVQQGIIHSFQIRN